MSYTDPEKQKAYQRDWAARKRAETPAKPASPPPVHRGENHPMAKLTAEIVAQIRAEPAGVTYRELGRKYHVHFATIGKIRRGELWPADA